MGTRAKWNLRDFFWGSTAERVVREARCAILAIKPAGFEQPAPTEAPEPADSRARAAQAESWPDATANWSAFRGQF